MVNLFEQTAEPIPLTQARHEYRVVPDVAIPGRDGGLLGRPGHERRPDRGRDDGIPAVLLAPSRHDARGDAGTSGTPSRRPSTRPNDRGTEVYLNLVDLDFDPARPADPTLVVRTTCTNRDLPAVLQQAGERLIFDLEAAAPLSRIRCVQSPSLPLRPPLRAGRTGG